MSNVLSQSEIDALLNAISSGSVDVDEMQQEGMRPEPKVREYDFRTANRFSKEQIRTLHIIYENFARLFANYLSGNLRTVCEVEVLSVEEQKYQEFVNALPTPVVLVLMGLLPLQGSTILEISPSVAYSMVNRVLGGTAASANLTKEFTEIELVIIERMVRQFVPLLRESWGKVLKMDPVVDRLETSPQFAQIVAMNEIILIITLNVRIGDSDGMINFVIPHMSIEPVLKLLSTKELFSGRSSSAKQGGNAAEIRSRIEGTPLTVRAAFNDTTSTVRDILNLSVGDVIQLDHKQNEPVTVMVGPLKKFRAALGVKDGRYAVKLSEVIREEENENEQ